MGVHNVGSTMSNIIEFPGRKKQSKSDLEAVIDQALSQIPVKRREKLKFELLKTIDSYDAFFTTWSLSIPKGASEAFKKQIYDIARQEHERKMMMLSEIIKLKIQVLVNEYTRGV